MAKIIERSAEIAGSPATQRAALQGGAKNGRHRRLLRVGGDQVTQFLDPLVQGILAPDERASRFEVNRRDR